MDQAQVRDLIEQAVGLLDAGCAGLLVDEVEAGSIVELHRLLVRAERLAAGAKLRLARRMVEAPGVSAAGVAAKLARESGTTVAEARRQIQISENLDGQPLLDAALGAGALSSEQTRAIAGGVAANPDRAAELVAAATAPDADLRELRRRSRQAVAEVDVDPEATRARHHRARAFRWWTDDDGMFQGHIQGPADAGARLVAAIKQASDEAFTGARQEGRRESPDAYAFDGLIDTVTAGTDGGGSVRGRERKVIGIVDVAPLRRGRLEPGDRCEINGVGPVSLSAMTELLGQATVALLFRSGTTDLAVAHLGRQPTAFQRTAVEARGYVCAVIGCGATRNLEIDHTVDWAATHKTVTKHLDWLCPIHHDAKTRGLIRLTGPPGDRQATPIERHDVLRT